jgi:ubiquitin carboxyl-terminal hydrolase L5
MFTTLLRGRYTYATYKLSLIRFVRRMDILNSDLGLQNEFEKWEKANKNPKRKKSTSKRKRKDQEEPGFHFIAYVPIHGTVWRLDGLQRQPINLGKLSIAEMSNGLWIYHADDVPGPSGDDWIAVARDNIYRRILQYEEDGVQFNLLSLCKSPAQATQQQLAENIKLLFETEKCLDEMVPDWKAFKTDDVLPQLRNLCESFGLSKELVDITEPPASALENLQRSTTDPSSLMKLHQELLKEQAILRGVYMDEAASIEQEDEQAARRKQDHTPRIYNATKALAEAGVLKDIVLDIRGNKS